METEKGVVTSVNSVSVIHHSTSMVYLIMVKEWDNKADGTRSETYEKLWLDSYQFADLKEAINKIT